VFDERPVRDVHPGLALVIVQAKPGEPGAITLGASSIGLAEVEVEILADE
jgi:hypothetical protein